MNYTSIRIATSDRDYVRGIADASGVSIAEQMHQIIRADRLARLRVEAERLGAVAEETGDAEQWRAEDRARLGSGQ